MRDVGCSDSSRYSLAASDATAQIVSGKAELADMGWQPASLFQRVLNRVRCGKSLRTEQQES